MKPTTPITFVKLKQGYCLKLGGVIYDATPYRTQAECREACRLENEEKGANHVAVFQ